MADYKGAKCISCGQVFKDGDDIVVCPECGTPYHRECYEKEGKCINTELHANGGSWHSDVKAADGYVHTGDGKVICPVCGGENDERAPFCTRCGHPLGIASQVKDEEYSRPGTDPEIIPILSADTIPMRNSEIQESVKWLIISARIRSIICLFSSISS